MNLFVGTTVSRIASAVLIALMGLVLIGSMNSPDAFAKKAKTTKVTLTIKTKNQASLLKAKKLVVKVRTNRKTKVNLSALGGGNGGSGGLFGRKTVRFGKGSSRTVSLALTKTGRTRLAKCGAKKVKVIGKYRKGKKQARAQRAKVLKKDPNRCKDPVEYVTVPLGDDPESCDFLDSTICLQPFPNDYFTNTSGIFAFPKQITSIFLEYSQ